eukprot:4464817-Pleurochrysis_carterae.AAC.1
MCAPLERLLRFSRPRLRHQPHRPAGLSVEFVEDVPPDAVNATGVGRNRHDSRLPDVREQQARRERHALVVVQQRRRRVQQLHPGRHGAPAPPRFNCSQSPARCQPLPPALPLAGHVTA